MFDFFRCLSEFWLHIYLIDFCQRLWSCAMMAFSVRRAWIEKKWKLPSLLEIKICVTQKFYETLFHRDVIWWNGLVKVFRTMVWETPFLLFTSICPPRKILMLWSLKISPCILKCSGIFKLSETFEFSLLPVSWFADFSWFSSTIKDI